MGKANQDVVVRTKWIGLEGMLRIVREKGEELSKRFVPAFMAQVNALEENLFADKELKLAREYGVSAMHQIKGVIYRSLVEYGRGVTAWKWI